MNFILKWILEALAPPFLPLPHFVYISNQSNMSGLNRAGPNRAEPSRAEPSRVEPSRPPPAATTSACGSADGWY